MMKKPVKYISGVVVALLISIGMLYVNNDIGINKSKLEVNARKSQKIEVDWQAAKGISKTMAAMIFYSKDLSDSTFSIYVNHPGLSFGYFFRAGGSVLETEEYIAECTVEGYDERAFISMNKQQVCKVEIDDGNEIRTIEIDSEKPFAVVLPNNCGNVVFYNINESVVESVLYRL